MPVGKLIFKLPDEEGEFKLAQGAGKMAVFIENVNNMMARRYKHAEPKSKEAYEEYEAIRKLYFDELRESGVEEFLWI